MNEFEWMNEWMNEWDKMNKVPLLGRTFCMYSEDKWNPNSFKPFAKACGSIDDWLIECSFLPSSLVYDSLIRKDTKKEPFS